MTSIFNKAMKAFPHDILIRILFIQFNYDQKYNLNGVKTTFEELRKMKKTNQVEYVIYCQEATIVSMKLISESENDAKRKIIFGTELSTNEKFDFEYNEIIC